MPWEIESGIYFATVSLLRELAGRPGGPPVEVHLQRSAARIGALLTDPAPPVGAAGLRPLLVDDADRLQALGGGLELRDEVDGGPPGRLTARAWLPDRLAPLVEAAAVPGVEER
jgi:hypothetical protein